MKKVFKVIVSVILSLTFIVSYLNVISDDVSAASARIVLDQAITCPQDDYTYEFRPDKTGYYLLDKRNWTTTEICENGTEVYLSECHVIPVGLFVPFEGGSYQEIFYMEYGKSYNVHFDEVCEFMLRRADKYVALNIGNREVSASLDKPFTLSITPTISSNIQLDGGVSYWWTDIPNDPDYTTSSITLNLRQLLDDNDQFVYKYDYGDSNSEFGWGYVSCYVSVLYEGNEFGWWVTYDIAGYATEFSSECLAYAPDDDYEHGLPYGYDFDDEFFEVHTEKPAGVNVSYQWHKVNSAKKKAGNYQSESELFTAINGQTANYFNFDQNARNVLGTPYIDMNGEDTHAYHELACVVRFSKGNSFVERILYFKLSFSFGVAALVGDVEDADYSSYITLPKDAKFQRYEGVEAVDGSFLEDDLPYGFSYRYTWYNCINSQDGISGWSWSGTGEYANLDDTVGDVDYLGTGKVIYIDPYSLSLHYSNGEYSSYVACFVEPMYNGERTYNRDFDVSLDIYKIKYGKFCISSYTSSYSAYPGDLMDIDVEVESVFDVTYQWQKLTGNGWVNIESSSAETATLLTVCDKETQYRCIITDEKGNSITSEPCVVTFEDGISIRSNPVDFTGYVGDTAKFSVEARGQDLTYQWQLKKGSKWANLTTGGANTPELSVKVDESKNGKIYRCVITDKNGNVVNTNEVSITVKEPAITITTQPKNYSGPAGSTAKFSVSAEGEGLNYQWQLKKGSKWADLSSGGAKTPTMSIKVDDSKNGKIYRCLITNADGEQLASNEVKITVKDPDINITSQPSDYSGLEGSTAKFTVAASGNGLTYQWQLKKGNSWADLSSGGAKTSTMSIKVDASKDGKVYRCLITNAAGEQLATNEVSITVKQPSNAITITKQPEDITVGEGHTAGFAVEAEGNGLTYQWQLKKGSSWANLTSGGANTNTLSLGKCDLSKNGKVYRCVITDANGEQITTNEVKISVFHIATRSEVAYKSAEPAADTTAAAPVTTNEAEAVNEAPAEQETPVTAESPAEVQAPAPEPAEAPVEEPA